MSSSCPSCGELLPDSYFETQLGAAESSQSETSASCPRCGALIRGNYLGPTFDYTPAQDDLTGKRIAHFVLQKRLGGGGFGEVWLARDETLDRDVAIKLPNSGGKETASLLHEARTAARLQHPHIVAVHEVGTTPEGRVYIASDYIAGTTLRDRLGGGRLSVEEALPLVIPIARALHYAHEHGVVHRDIKPANVLLNEEGRPSVTDFGIAKRISEEDTKSYDGQVVGTAKYMSPEQAAGKTRETGRRSDLYSLGVLLFEMLTGEVPFRGNMRAIINQKQVDDPPSPRTLNPKLPRDLETICLKCLEREPGRRYATAAELADELERVQRGEPILARPVSQTERLWRWCQRRPAVAGLLAALFLSLSIGLSGVTYFWRQAEHNAVRLSQSLYRARMNFIGTQLVTGDIAGVQSLLQKMTADSPPGTEPGFELGYFQSVVAPFQRVASHGSEVVDVAVTPDGDLCASIGNDRRIRVWDVATGEEVRALSVDVGRFTTIDFSPTSGDLASGSNDAMIRLWNPRRDARMLDQEKHGSQVKLVRYSRSGKWLLSLGEKGGVRVWTARDLQLVAEIPIGPGLVGADARWVGKEDHLLIAAENGQLRFVQLKPGPGGAAESPKAAKTAWELLRTIEPPTRSEGSADPNDLRFLLRAIAVSDDERLVAAGSYHGQLACWSLEDGQLLNFVATPHGRVDDIEFLADSPVAAVAQSDGRTHFINFETAQDQLALSTHDLVDAALARSQNGKSLLVGNLDGTVLRLGLDVIGRQIPATLWHGAAIEDVAFLPDGRQLLAADWSKESKQGELRLWNTANGAWRTIALEGEPGANVIAVQPRGDLVATGGTGSNVVIRHGADLQLVRKLPVTETGCMAISFSPDGDRLAVALHTGSLYLYRTKAWDEPPVKLPPRETLIRAIMYTPDSRRLAVAWEDGMVRLLDAARGEETGVAWRAPSPPSALGCCGPQVLAIATEAGDMHLWNLQSAESPRTIRAHTGRIFSVAALAGGATLATVGVDRDLKLWDVASGELNAALPGHFRRVFAVDVSPDGRTIASGGLEGDIRLWRSGAP